MKTLDEIRQEFAVQWQRARALGLDRILPDRFEIDPGEPPGGADGYFVAIVSGVAHFQFSLYYAPPIGTSWSHRYLHEIGHALLTLLRNMTTDPIAADNYLRTRHWAWRWRGALNPPANWQLAQQQATSWATLPNEMWAESVACAIETTEHERTMNWGQAVPAYAIRFFIELSREISPVVYPQPPGETLIAKADNDSLFFYQTSDVPPKVVVRNGIFQTLGKDLKFW